MLNQARFRLGSIDPFDPNSGSRRLGTERSVLIVKRSRDGTYGLTRIGIFIPATSEKCDNSTGRNWT